MIAEATAAHAIAALVGVMSLGLFAVSGCEQTVAQSTDSGTTDTAITDAGDPAAVVPCSLEVFPETGQRCSFPPDKACRRGRCEFECVTECVCESGTWTCAENCREGRADCGVSPVCESVCPDPT